MWHEGVHIFLYISKLVAKVPGLNLGKKNNQLTKQPWGLELVINILYIFPLQNNGPEKCTFRKVKKDLKFQKIYQIQYSTMYFMLKLKLEIQPSELSSSSWKTFLSHTNKHDFSSELFSNLLIW